MTPADLRAWRASMSFTQRQAAGALGISFATFRNYERGERFERDEQGDPIPAPIPLYIALACAAISAGLKPYTRSKR